MRGAGIAGAFRRVPAGEALPVNIPGRPRWVVISALGICQIFAWGGSYYLLAVLALPIGKATGWSTIWILGGLSVGLLVSGLVSPTVGRAIDRRGGRPVLAVSAVLLSAGLAVIAIAPHPFVYVGGWIIIGLGMGAGLYDPAFSALGRLYGDEARSAITHLTLFGGFASTVCWPLSAFLVERLGWRGASLSYAGIDLAIVLPLYLLGLPRERTRPPALRRREAAAGATSANRPDRRAFLLLAAGLTVASVIMTIISVDILTLLQTRGLTLAAAVGLGALIGPAQVGARVVEAAFGRRHHPIWSLLASTLLVVAGLALLLGPASLIGAGLVLYGSGSGIRSIARGTVPLAMFGKDGYAILMGWLAMPILVAQAASPAIGSLLVGGLARRSRS